MRRPDRVPRGPGCCPSRPMGEGHPYEARITPVTATGRARSRPPGDAPSAPGAATAGPRHGGRGRGDRTGRRRAGDQPPGRLPRDRRATRGRPGRAARPARFLPGRVRGRPPRGYQQVTGFGRIAGPQPNVAGYFSGWAEPCAASFAGQARRHHAVTLVQMDPSYAPVAAIAAGSYDSHRAGLPRPAGQTTSPGCAPSTPACPGPGPSAGGGPASMRASITRTGASAAAPRPRRPSGGEPAR